MGAVAEMYDGWDWQQLRDEVGRLAQATATHLHRAERDREDLVWVARSVLRRVAVDNARHFARRDAPIAGLTFPVALDVDTMRRILKAYDLGQEDQAANRRAAVER